MPSKTNLQTILDQNLIVGGRTALELQGFAHYLPSEIKEVHVYSRKRPAPWLNKLPLNLQFVFHNRERLFRSAAPIPPSVCLGSPSHEPRHGLVSLPDDLVAQPWGNSGWPLTLSSPERAVLELLDELPDHESFHQVDKLMEGLANLSPRRIEKLLLDCHSVKVKRLFFFFADRHKHAWLRHIHKDAIDFGKGKRMLVRGGKLNTAYQITVPEGLNGVQ